MSLWNFSRDPSGVLVLLQVGSEKGLDADKLLRGSRLSQTQLGSPNCELSAAQELRVIENLLAALHRPPGLGLDVGLRCHFSTFGMWGYWLISSATLGDAVDVALDHLQLTFAYSSIKKVIRGDQAFLTFYPPPDLSPNLKRFVVEREMGTAASLLEDIGGPDFHLSEFRLQDGNGRMYVVPEKLTKIAGADITRSNGYHLAFPAKWLAFRPSTANPLTAAMCEQACKRLVERRRGELQVGEIVKEYLSVSTAPTIPTLDTISRLTNTSVRTLKRRMQGEGLSFRSLVSDERSKLAAELVLDRSQPLADIAARLGYSSPSCFSQAFKRWHGVSPSQFRQHQDS